jgi:hypothetical protein
VWGKECELAGDDVKKSERVFKETKTHMSDPVGVDESCHLIAYVQLSGLFYTKYFSALPPYPAQSLTLPATNSTPRSLLQNVPNWLAAQDSHEQRLQYRSHKHLATAPFTTCLAVAQTIVVQSGDTKSAASEPGVLKS